MQTSTAAHATASQTFTTRMLADGSFELTYQDRVATLSSTGTVQTFAGPQTHYTLTCGSFVARDTAYSNPARTIKSLVRLFRIYVQALELLAVEVDRRLDALPAKTRAKQRKMFELAAERVRKGELACDSHLTMVGLAVGDTFIALPIEHEKTVAGQTERGYAFGEFRTYCVGDAACYDRYNLHYIGTIEAITPKTIRVSKRDGKHSAHMKHDAFIGHNYHTVEAMERENAITSQYI